MKTLLRRGLAIAAVLAIGACSDDGPSGPGSYTVTVSGSVPLGAVVIDFAGAGINGASVGGGDWIAEREHSEGLRVVAVSNDGGLLQFELAVSDIAAPQPVPTVIQASTADDRILVSTNGIEVALTR